MNTHKVWLKNGDHQSVTPFRQPDPEFAGPKLCPDCARSYHYHGWRDNRIMVCPGDLVPL